MRRAQADQLERRLATGTAVPESPEVEHWAELAEQLRSVAPVALVPRQAFRDDLRARLMTEAAELTTDRVTSRSRSPVESRPRFRRTRRTLAGVVVAAVLGGGAAAVASTGAVPGDALYGLKRTFEDVRMQLAGSETAKGGAALGQARERLAEAEELALTTPGGVEEADSPQLREALGDFAASSQDGITRLLQHYADEGDPASLAEVDAFVRETLPLLERLRSETPPSLHPVIDALIFGLQNTSADLASTVADCGAPCTSLGLVAADPQPRQGLSLLSSDVGEVSGAVPGAPLPGAPTATVPTDPVDEPAAPGGGLLPPLPGQSTDPLAPITDPLGPIITDPLGQVTSIVAPLIDPLLSPTPAPAPSPSPTLPLPCLVNLIGNCPG